MTKNRRGWWKFVWLSRCWQQRVGVKSYLTWEVFIYHNEVDGFTGFINPRRCRISSINSTTINYLSFAWCNRYMFRLVRVDQDDAPSGCSEYQSCHILSRSPRTWLRSICQTAQNAFSSSTPSNSGWCKLFKSPFMATHHHLQEEIIELTGKDLKLRVDLSPGIST